MARPEDCTLTSGHAAHLRHRFHPFKLRKKSATPEAGGGSEVLRIGPPRPRKRFRRLLIKSTLSQLDGSLVHELFNAKGAKFAANT